MLYGMWDLSSLARDWILVPCTGSGSLNHQTTREVLYYQSSTPNVFIYASASLNILDKPPQIWQG